MKLLTATFLALASAGAHADSLFSKVGSEDAYGSQFQGVAIPGYIQHSTAISEPVDHIDIWNDVRAAAANAGAWVSGLSYSANAAAGAGVSGLSYSANAAAGAGVSGLSYSANAAAGAEVSGLSYSYMKGNTLSDETGVNGEIAEEYLANVILIDGSILKDHLSKMPSPSGNKNRVPRAGVKSKPVGSDKINVIVLPFPTS